MAINTGKALAAEQRRSQALELKRAGVTYYDISERLGISRAQAHIDVKRRLGECRRNDAQAVQEEYELQRDRYERLLRRWWPMALNNDDAVAGPATLTVLNILRQLNIIGGLIPEKPLIQFNAVVTDGTTTFADLLREATTPIPIVEGTTNGHAG